MVRQAVALVEPLGQGHHLKTQDRVDDQDLGN